MTSLFSATRRSKRGNGDEQAYQETDTGSQNLQESPVPRRRGRGSIAITEPQTAIRGDLLEAFTKKQLLDLGFWEYKYANLDGLKNLPFGPFRTRNWHMNKHQLKALHPVLQLASKLILSPASIKFCDALIFNRRVKDVRASRIWYPRGNAILEELRYGPSQDCPVSELKADVCFALERLAENLHWYALTPSNRSWPTLQYTDAITTRQHIGSVGSDIHINYKSIETLRILRNNPRPDVSNVNAILRLQMHLAITVCHEMIHALNHFVRTNPPFFVEPFFNDNRITEMGFSWEQEVFGGEINWWWDETDFAAKAFLPITIMKWPSAWMWGDDFRQPILELQRRWPKPSSTMFFVPMWWVHGLFQDGFWNDVHGRGDDLRLLHPPKTHGIRVFSGAPHHIDGKWRKSLSSERYEHDHKGRVVKYPDLEAQLMPTPPGRRFSRASRVSPSDIVTGYGELPRWAIWRLSRPSEPDSDSDRDSNRPGRWPSHLPATPFSTYLEEVEMGDNEWRFAIPGRGVDEKLLGRFSNASMETTYEAIDKDGNSLERDSFSFKSPLARQRRKKGLRERRERRREKRRQALARYGE